VSEVNGQSETAEPTAPRGDPRRPLYFFTYLALLLLDALVLNVALLLPGHSLAYQWMNRLGIFLAVIILFGLFIWAEWTSVKWKSEAPSRGLKWLLPVLFGIKMWNRILDAFWLR
jgi:hypothetical protein